MNFPNRSLLVAATFTLATIPISAQRPPTQGNLWPAGSVLHDTGADGALWSAGAVWKARFDARGATFWAASGEGGPAPSARFQLLGVEQSTTHAPLHVVAPVRNGDRVTYARGAAEEFFDVRADGIEQQFLLRELNRTSDLVLTVGVDTALTVERAEQGHVLRGESGAITYGEAIAIDATGARLALATVWRDGAFHITVPAAFLATARLPLLVDPMIGTPVTAWTSGARVLTSTDIAFDASLSRYYVSYERVFSTTDRDVYVSHLDAGMTVQGLLAIDISTEFWTEPRIAVLEAHDTACVVAEKSTAGASPFAVAIRRIVDLDVQTPAFLSGFLDVTYRHPSIGGDANPTGPSRFLLAYERTDSAVNNNEIWFGRMDASGNPFSTTFLGTGIGFKRRMSISKTCAPVGDANARWAILYRFEPYQQTLGNLRVSMIRRDGTRYTSTAITGDTPNAGSQWAVSSAAQHAAGWLFLAAEIRVNGFGRGDLFAHVFNGGGNVNVVAGDVLVLGNSADHRHPAVDSDGTRFSVACSAKLSATDADLRVRTLSLLGGQLVPHDADTPSYSPDFDTSPAICWGGAPNSYGMAWVRHTAGANYAVVAQAYRGLGAGAVTTRTTGCGPVSLTTSGVPALGETFTLGLVSNAALYGFFLGRPVAVAIPGCAGCVQGAEGLVLYGASLPLTIPTNVHLVGVMLAAQGFAVDFAGLPCLGQIALSHTVDFRVR
jgi:hypothetical protein